MQRVRLSLAVRVCVGMSVCLCADSERPDTHTNTLAHTRILAYSHIHRTLSFGVRDCEASEAQKRACCTRRPVIYSIEPFGGSVGGCGRGGCEVAAPPSEECSMSDERWRRKRRYASICNAGAGNEAQPIWNAPVSAVVSE